MLWERRHRPEHVGAVETRRSRKLLKSCLEVMGTQWRIILMPKFPWTWQKWKSVVWAGHIRSICGKKQCNGRWNAGCRASLPAFGIIHENVEVDIKSLNSRFQTLSCGLRVRCG